MVYMFRIERCSVLGGIFSKKSYYENSGLNKKRSIREVFSFGRCSKIEGEVYTSDSLNL